MSESLVPGSSFLLWTPINTTTLQLNVNYPRTNNTDNISRCIEIVLYGCASNNEGLFYYCVIFAVI